ncbi:flagellar protein export ATPase FliI [Psychrosphaera sp. 1_MG-2023]|uniref:flagellar protein export ATPase FliI n=1 Tax=Psychrosphaera sp. 1_MG-2023 TaxID=3062643 RepID=UPI0026E42204|nr:flagellar protein export ATPase FliI [Psychrosphaera sp. 1_MG-2023]MDO6718435.1 flagellar protein export ATPase FliI [Psychrosphaera sp. 1_MG-2023]
MTTELLERIAKYKNQVVDAKPEVSGRLTKVAGLTLEAVGCSAPLGGQCRVQTANGDVDAEVVGFENDKIYLMPLDKVQGVLPGGRVTVSHASNKLPLSLSLLGRVIDPSGQPLDDLGAIDTDSDANQSTKPINPLSRRPVKTAIDVGVKAINGVITVGQGQRMGLFAGSGVGKSVLLGMMTKGTTADVIVVGLIGERGREVKEFIDEILGDEGRKRAVVVAAPADMSPIRRLKGCETATQIAEYFRDKGLNVLLLIDSITRYAQAQREIALAIGEPPATKGYPASVFAKLPALVERAGNGGEGQGSITAFYTVLSEGDDLQDPIADASRAILDGHIVLSRDLADSGHYPAIDVGRSISRVMPQVTSPEHLHMALMFKKLLSAYEQNKDLISIGAYAAGSNPIVDKAILLKPVIDAYLQQRMDDVVPYDQALMQLQALVQQIK